MIDRQWLQSQLADLGDVPDEVLDMVLQVAGPLLERHERLLALDLNDVEPFCPARRLSDDAA